MLQCSFIRAHVNYASCRRVLALRTQGRVALIEVKQILLRALAYLSEYRGSLFKALLIPSVTLALLEAVPDKHIGQAWHIFEFILVLLISSMIAISVHRIILLGPESVSEWGVYVPRAREFLFVLCSVGLGICLIPFSMLALVPFVGGILMPLGMLFVVARLSLVFPSIATGWSMTFVDSWEKTQNHTLTMMCVVGFVPLLVTIPEWLLSDVAYLAPLLGLLSAFSTVCVVAVLSVTFMVLVEGE